jgi:hypothetical protein
MWIRVDFVLSLVTSKEEVYIEELPQTMEGIRAASQARLVYGRLKVKRPQARRAPSNSASSTASSETIPPRRRPAQTPQGTDQRVPPPNTDPPTAHGRLLNASVEVVVAEEHGRRAHSTSRSQCWGDVGCVIVKTEVNLSVCLLSS